jgi:hypothetical protein
MATDARFDAEKFFAAARDQGIEEAISRHGQSLHEREQAALRQLNTEDLNRYASTYLRLREGAGGAPTQDWACGAVC